MVAVIEVNLTWDEWMVAGVGALTRQLTALKKNRTPRVPGNEQFDEAEAHVSGAQAEYAVAKWLGVMWVPAAGISSASQVEGDVGKLEVRSTAHPRGGLLIRKDDFDDRPYILVNTRRAPTYELVGWVYGREAKREEFWRPDFKTPCYRFPPEKLRPCDALIHGPNDHIPMRTAA